MEMNLGNLSVIVVGILIGLFFFARWWNKKLGVDPLTGEELPDKSAATTKSNDD